METVYQILKTVLVLAFFVEQLFAPKIAGGDFESRADIKTDDEIMVLANSVNDMSEHLEIMVDTIKEDEAKMRHAELRLLQQAATELHKRVLRVLGQAHRDRSCFRRAF